MIEDYANQFARLKTKIRSNLPANQIRGLIARKTKIRPNLPANQIRGLKIQSRVNAAVFSPMIERRASVHTKVFN
jgi:hypothetical protein